MTATVHRLHQLGADRARPAADVDELLLLRKQQRGHKRLGDTDEGTAAITRSHLTPLCFAQGFPMNEKNGSK